MSICAANKSEVVLRHRRTNYGCGIAVIAVLLTSGLCQLANAEESKGGYQEQPITEDDRQHWAYQIPQAVVPPGHDFTGWRRNEIDDFVAAALSEQNLRPQPAANANTLLRRLCYGLAGLPPSLDELNEFTADPDDSAYTETIDRLLDSPSYGERWAQHWLDLARFAETDGFEHDKVRDHAWTYRDWVITALNDDMSYDEFIKQQIAGDELYPDSESAANATRFCLSGPDMPDINLLEERRHTLLNEMTSTVGAVILGLQLGCAQCHDHKYDAISQADFYRLRAAFEPSLQLKKNKSVTRLQEVFPYGHSSHVMLRGDFRRTGPEVPPGIIRVVAMKDYRHLPKKGSGTAGRRAALANWFTDGNNPLTARVMVNRVWQHHFGVGLVDTPSDFGLMGSEPSHYELLDWLAVWFVRQEWSLKKLHRLIVNSATYRQRSMLPGRASETERRSWRRALDTDPNARLLSRYPRWRLEGEAIRDAMLLASGQLNRKRGGPGVRPPLPKELVGTLLKNQWSVTKDTAEHSRRSIYVFARRNLRYPIFEAFDRPAANATCPDRAVSTTAPQSLHLLNSEFSLSMAEKLAQRVNVSSADRKTQITEVFLRTVSRQPTATELNDVADFLKHQDADTAMTHLCLSLFNSNEFVFVD